LFGLYNDRASIVIDNSESTQGKAIVPATTGSTIGKVDSYTGAYLSKEYNLTRGDLLLIKPGKTSNDLFTVS